MVSRIGNHRVRAWGIIAIEESRLSAPHQACLVKRGWWNGRWVVKMEN